MARIRTIKPEFFKCYKLYAAEKETGLPLRIAYAGLWTACDKEGRFKWLPEELKLDCLPYDEVDFSRVLDALLTREYIVKYASENNFFGYIPSWKEHQVVNNRESESKLPKPSESNMLTREARVPDATQICLSGKEGERKGKEGEREGENAHAHASEESSQEKSSGVESENLRPDQKEDLVDSIPATVIVDFKLVAERMTGQIWLEKVCMANHFELAVFRDFVKTWCKNKEITGDTMYPIGKLMGFVIEDFRKANVKKGPNGATNRLLKSEYAEL